MRTWVAEPAEAAVIAGLLIEFRDHYGRDRPPDDSFISSVQRLIVHPDAEFLLGAPREDPDAAGVCQLRYRHSVWTAADDCWLEDLFVREAARGEGLGGALVSLALERARARGCRRVELDANESNHAALALYRRMGFSERSKSPGGAGRDLFLGRSLEEDGR
jgi:ribosomal protein S18 acetylase RimI-like enzyme